MKQEVVGTDYQRPPHCAELHRLCQSTAPSL